MIRCDEGFICAGEIILSSSWLSSHSDSVVLESVRKMEELSIHPFLKQTSPGIAHSYSSIEEFLATYQQSQIKVASISRKRELMPVRRLEFASRRAELELALIARDGYVCAQTGCDAMSDLTIDHVQPLSKGGTDALENLRFLCRSHNSSKGDR